MLYRLRNWRARARGWKAEVSEQFGFVGPVARLEAVLIKADGTRIDLGILSKRVVTNNGVGHIVDSHQNLAEMEAINFHDCGTGTTAEAATDSALVTPYGGARATGTQSEPASNQYRSTGTVSFTSTLAITEHGIFSASTVGTLFDRSVFAAINVVSGDSIQFTYTVTYTAGG